MEYKIIKVYGCPETDNLEMELEDEVNVYINKGWRPFGSICIVNVGVPENCEKNFVEVWQPMIKQHYNEN
jgi:hypothetical protein